MTREEAIKEIEKVFEPAFANYIITALTEGATVSDKEPTTENDLGVDAISRKAVIDMLNEHKEFISFTTFKRFIELLYKLPPVTPQEPRWIPVSERYPKPDDEYKFFLVTDEKGKVSVQEFYLSLDEEPQPYFSGMTNVVAWMPLPKPYSEVEE